MSVRSWSLVQFAHPIIFVVVVMVVVVKFTKLHTGLKLQKFSRPPNTLYRLIYSDYHLCPNYYLLSTAPAKRALNSCTTGNSGVFF